MNKRKAFNEENAYIKARKRVENLKGFYGNLAAYVSFVPTMILVNYLTNWRFQCFWIPLLAWGLGFAIHAYTVFGQPKTLGKNGKKKKLAKL